jgi:hypothetical protein
MAPQKRKGRIMILLKPLILFIACLSFLSLFSCNGGTGSTAGTSGYSGTGTGWTVTVEKFVPSVSISKGESTMVVMKVKDAIGAPAPNGTRVCFSVSYGSIWVDEIGKETPVRTGCHGTSNDRGEAMGTYFPPEFPVTDYIQASSNGAIGSTTIVVVP